MRLKRCRIILGSSGKWLRVVSYRETNVTEKEKRVAYSSRYNLETVGSVRNVGTYLPNYTVSHPKHYNLNTCTREDLPSLMMQDNYKDYQLNVHYNGTEIPLPQLPQLLDPNLSPINLFHYHIVHTCLKTVLILSSNPMKLIFLCFWTTILHSSLTPHIRFISHTSVRFQTPNLKSVCNRVI